MTSKAIELAGFKPLIPLTANIDDFGLAFIDQNFSQMAISLHLNNYITVAQKCGFGMGVVFGEPCHSQKLLVSIFLPKPNLS